MTENSVRKFCGNKNRTAETGNIALSCRQRAEFRKSECNGDRDGKSAGRRENIDCGYDKTREYWPTVYTAKAVRNRTKRTFTAKQMQMKEKNYH